MKDNNRENDFLSDRELEQIATSDEVINWLPKFIGPLTDDVKNEFKKFDEKKKANKGGKN